MGLARVPLSDCSCQSQRRYRRHLVLPKAKRQLNWISKLQGKVLIKLFSGNLSSSWSTVCPLSEWPHPPSPFLGTTRSFHFPRDSSRFPLACYLVPLLCFLTYTQEHFPKETAEFCLLLNLIELECTQVHAHTSTCMSNHTYTYSQVHTPPTWYKHNAISRCFCCYEESFWQETRGLGSLPNLSETLGKDFVPWSWISLKL